MSSIKENIQQELLAWTRHLWKIGNENPFQVPDGYFDQLQDQILTRIDIKGVKADSSSGNPMVPADYFSKMQHAVLQQIAKDELSGLPVELQDVGNNPFKVPKGYFEQSKSKILQLTSGVSESRVIPLWSRRAIRWIAASIIGIVAVAWLFFQEPLTDDSPLLAEISTLEMYDYLELNIDELPLEEFAEEEQLQELETQTLEIDNSEIEDYLMNQMDDLNIDELL